MAITLGLVEAVDDNGVYVSMPGTRGVLRGPFRAVSDVVVGASVLVTATDDGEQVVVGVVAPGVRTSVVSVRDFGAVGDGVTDDTSAVQAALDASSADQLMLMLPAGTYKTTATLTVGSNTTVIGAGTISAIVPGALTPAITVDGDDVVIDGITVNGNKASYAGVTEWKHGISIAAGCTAVTLRNVTCTANKGDGVYLDGSATPPTRVTLENVTCSGNHRQGLSIVSGRDVLVIGGSYSSTSGTAPQSGIDIEPDDDAYVIDGITLLNVALDDNAGPGLQIDMRVGSDCQRGVRIIGGRAKGNDSGLLLKRLREVTVDGMVIDSNTNVGVEVNGDVTEGLRLQNCVIRLNGDRGVYAHPGTNPMDVMFVGNHVVDNAVDGAAEGVMFDAAGTVFTAHNRITNETVGNQTYGLRTTANVTGETHIANMLTGNDTADASYAGTASARLVIGQGALNVTGSRGSNAALASLLTQLASLGLITDSTT